jgi:hypothetical protein
MRKLLLAATALIALTGAASATTLTQADVGSFGTGTFNGLIGGQTLIPALHGTLTLGLTSVNAATNTWNFSYSLTNTTSAPWTSEISAFGFNTTPTLVSASSTGYFDKAVINVNVAGGIGQMDFCATAGSTCNGGASQGLDNGETGTGTFSLDFAGMATAGTAITLEDYFIRYQAINGPNVSGASGVGFGDVGVFINPNVGAVPEASTWAMMLLGFAGVGFMAYRRRQNGNTALRLA